MRVYGFGKQRQNVTELLVAIPVGTVFLGAPDFVTPASMAVHEPKVDASALHDY